MATLFKLPQVAQEHHLPGIWYWVWLKNHSKTHGTHLLYPTPPPPWSQSLVGMKPRLQLKNLDQKSSTFRLDSNFMANFIPWPFIPKHMVLRVSDPNGLLWWLAGQDSKHRRPRNSSDYLVIKLTLIGASPSWPAWGLCQAPSQALSVGFLLILSLSGEGLSGICL